MALLGSAALMIWSDIETERAFEQGAWHSFEHLPERMALPGFLRGRRGMALEAQTTRFFVLYELQDLAAMTSPAYLARLNAPTEWTLRLNAMVSNVNRSPGRTVSSWGEGIGGSLLTLRLKTTGEDPGRILDACNALTAGLDEDQRLVGGHLLQIDPSSVVSTLDQRLRRRPDATADFVIVLEGFDADGLRAVWRDRSAALLSLRVDVEATQCTCVHVVRSDGVPPP